MTDETAAPAAKKAPSHIAYIVPEKGEWTRIGAAWTNADGKGFNIKLDAIPVNGRITLRINEPKQDAGA